ncbi:MAG: hypothetical protein WKG03_22665 [Telluria sp.]
MVKTAPQPSDNPKQFKRLNIMAEARYVEIKSTTTTPKPVRKRAEVKIKRAALVGEIVEVSWKSGIDVARERKTVVGPHWKKGEDVKEEDDPGHQKYFGGSTRPGYYLVKNKAGHAILVVKIEIKKSHDQEATGILTGLLGTLKFEGKCPTTVGVHFVGLVISNLPNTLAHYEGDASWSLSTSKISVPLSNITRLELFIGLDRPASFYKEGVWVEALRFLFKKMKASGENDVSRVAQFVTQYCHSKHGMRYEAMSGAGKFGVESMGGFFYLMKYINWPNYPSNKNNVYGDTINNVVNCYDQAAAVQSLCGAIGVKVVWVFYNPFGYIKTANIVGVGNSNSPFFMSKGAKAKPIVENSGMDRTAFHNHAFLQVGDWTGNILDACAGPHIGNESMRQYLYNSIDADICLAAPAFGGLIGALTQIAPRSGAHYCELLMKRMAMWKPDGIEEVK